MDEIDWWDAIFSDVGAVERRALNQAAEELGLLNISADLNQEQIHKLFALDKAQREEIERLRLTIKVLTEILVDSGVVAEAAFTERMQAALAAREEAKAARAKAKAEKIVRCQQCGVEVPARSTNLTEWGLVCDACHQKQ